MNRVTIRTILAGLLALVGTLPAIAANHSLRVVTTLSTFADLTKSIGGAFVTVDYIASPKFNPHFIEPKPSDVIKVKNADLLVHGGLDLELWRWPLLDAASNREVMAGGSRDLDLSRGIQLLEVPDHTVSRSEGDMHLYGNPHYWTNPENGKIIATEIEEKLAELDPAHASDYQRNLHTFLAQLEHKISLWQQGLAPLKGREVIAYHNEWPYLMEFAGLTIKYYLEPKPGIPPTPKQIEFLEQYVRQHQIRGIVQATYFPTKAAEILAKRSGAKVVFLCQNVGEIPACSDYIATIDYNVAHLISALQP